MNDTSAVCDFPAAMDRVDNDRELYFELIDMFFDDYEDAIAALSTSIAQRNWKAVEGGAHALKSALGNLGAMTSYDAAFRLERAARSPESGNDLTKAKGELEQEIGRFRKEVTSLRANHDSNNS